MNGMDVSELWKPFRISFRKQPHPVPHSPLAALTGKPPNLGQTNHLFSLNKKKKSSLFVY